MLPLLILVVPPSVAAGSYLSWSLGQYTVVRYRNLAGPPTAHSFASYASGFVALGGTYGAIEVAFSKFEESSSGSDVRGGVKEKPKFEPPKSIGEAVGKMGPPVLKRLGAASVAFFCAGVVQLCVASSMGMGSRGSKSS